MATHSSTLPWKIPWTEEPGRLQSMGWQKSDTTEQLHFHVLSLSEKTKQRTKQNGDSQSTQEKVQGNDCKDDQRTGRRMDKQKNSKFLTKSQKI